MPDPKVEKWRQRGRIFCWRSKIHPYELNITADDDGFKSLDLLFQLMISARWRTSVRINVTPSNRTANNDKNFKNIQSLEFEIYPDAKDRDLWHIEETAANKIRICFGSGYISQLISSVQKGLRGIGDFSIGDPKLWFWWMLNEQE
jgi:hypothetical protein